MSADGGRLSRLDRIPISEAARRLVVSEKTVRNLLSKHRADFAPSVYGWHGRQRKIRLLTEADVRRLAGLLSCWSGSKKGAAP